MLYEDDLKYTNTHAELTSLHRHTITAHKIVRKSSETRTHTHTHTADVSIYIRIHVQRMK